MRLGMRFSAYFKREGGGSYSTVIKGHTYTFDGGEQAIDCNREYGCEVINRCSSKLWRVRLLKERTETVEAWSVYSTSFGDLLPPFASFVGANVPENYIRVLRNLPWVFPAVFQSGDHDGPLLRVQNVPVRPLFSGPWGRLFGLGKRFLVSPMSVGASGIWCELVSPMIGDERTPEQLASNSFRLRFSSVGRYGLHAAHGGRTLCPAPGWIPFPKLGESREVCLLSSPVELPSVGFVIPQSAYFAADSS